jgi:hypothetical protein
MMNGTGMRRKRTRYEACGSNSFHGVFDVEDNGGMGLG